MAVDFDLRVHFFNINCNILLETDLQIEKARLAAVVAVDVFLMVTRMLEN